MSERLVQKRLVERWQAAAERAVREGTSIHVLPHSGIWIAVSKGGIYELNIIDNLAYGCSCLAGKNGDPVCKHRAAFYVCAGALEPVAPAKPDLLPSPALVDRLQVQAVAI